MPKIEIRIEDNRMKKITLIPVLYINGINAAFSRGEQTAGETGALAEAYYNNGADGLLLIETATDDAGHDKSIGEMKEIVRRTELPLYTAGNLHRLEDVKKYTYTGAKKVFVNADDPEEMKLLQEATDRFGTDKVEAAFYEGRLVELGTDFDENMTALELYLDLARQDEGEEVRVYVTADVDTDFYAYKYALKESGYPTITYESAVGWSEFKLNSDGMVPVIVQDYRTNEVLMLAYMNEAAFEETIRGGKMCYYSRSRQERWLKGETSGHYQYVKSLYLDCDNDTILAKVAQVGAACHTGARSCFFPTLLEKEGQTANPHKVFEDVYQVIADRKVHPKEGSYTNYLFDKGIDKILKKCGEEATEIVIAAKNPDPEEIKYEISDFLYHVMVLMVERGVTWEDITAELANR